MGTYTKGKATEGKGGTCLAQKVGRLGKGGSYKIAEQKTEQK